MSPLHDSLLDMDRAYLKAAERVMVGAPSREDLNLLRSIGRLLRERKRDWVLKAEVDRIKAAQGC